jgi:hypothetical protein
MAMEEWYSQRLLHQVFLFFFFERILKNVAKRNSLVDFRFVFCSMEGLDCPIFEAKLDHGSLLDDPQVKGILETLIQDRQKKL